MNFKYLNIIVAFAILTCLVLFAPLKRVHIRKYIPRNEKFRSGEDDDEEEGIGGAIEWLNRRRVNQSTGTIDIKDIIKAEKGVSDLMNHRAKSALGLQWIEMGPNNIGGRTRALLVDKDNTSLIFAGGVGGGLWKSSTEGSSWVKYSDTIQNLAVSCITQAINGDIYFGTGESFASTMSGNVSGTPGFKGAGIWKSTDHGQHFVQLYSTWNDSDDSKTVFYGVNKLAHDPFNPNKIFVATERGIRISTDAGSSWFNPFPGISRCTDVKVASDGTIIAAIGNRCWIANDSDSSYTFVNHSTGNNGDLPSGTGRLEFAFSPTNPNYVYCLAAKISGALYNLYYSSDKGSTWNAAFSNITSDFVPFGATPSQGSYDNVISVYPDNPQKVIFGGVCLFTWSLAENYVQLSSPTGFPHADQHAIIFHPHYNGTTNKILYLSNDGGVFRNADGGSTLSWSEINKNYNVTQFYDIDCGGNGDVLGGTQDNGSLYLSTLGNTPLSALSVTGGDGGGAAISKLSPNILFTTIYYSQCLRSDDAFDLVSHPFVSFYSDSVKNQHQDIGVGGEPFVTPIALWESFNDVYSIDTIRFIVRKITNAQGDTIKPKYAAGDQIYLTSRIHERVFGYTLTPSDVSKFPNDTLVVGDTLWVKDPYQAVLAVGFNGDIWITRYPLDFTKVPPPWHPIVLTTAGLGSIATMAWSGDGDILYVADDNNSLFRFSNILKARTTAQMDATYSTCIIKMQKIANFGGQAITGIAVDPVLSNNVVVALGNYGNTNYVEYSTNAATTYTSSGNFSAKQGNLPKFPVYSALISWNDSKKVIIGTEYGTYSTTDITVSSPVWADENVNGMPHDPVFKLTQGLFPNNWDNQISNQGVIYACTHGRGVFRTETIRAPLGISNPVSSDTKSASAIVFPNPTNDKINISFNLDKSGDIDNKIYDIHGRLLFSEVKSNQIAGKQNYSLHISNLQSGTYILKITTGSKSFSTKFVVY